MIDTKDYERGVEKIAYYSDKIFTIDDFAPNAVSAQKLVKIIANYNAKIRKMSSKIHISDFEACKSLSEAIEKAKQMALENNGIVVVCGSLYLASKFLNDYQK